MRGFIAGTALLIFFCLVMNSATAKWKKEYASQPEYLQNWYSGQKNGKGQWCCSKADGHRYDGSVTFLPDGSVKLDGGIILPAYMVLNGPNLAGHAVWWFITSWDGTRTDYCFAPPTMG